MPTCGVERLPDYCHISKDTATELREEVWGGDSGSSLQPKEQASISGSSRSKKNTGTDCPAVCRGVWPVNIFLWDFWHSEWWQNTILTVFCLPDYVNWWLCWGTVTADGTILLAIVTLEEKVTLEWVSLTSVDVERGTCWDVECWDLRV